MKKYKFTSEKMGYGNKTLRRIKALRDGKFFKKGQLGGFIESEKNLSHQGECWVAESAFVYENAIIKEDAVVSGHARVSENAVVYGSAHIYESAHISGCAYVFGNAQIYDNAVVSGEAQIYGNAHVKGFAYVTDRVNVFGQDRVTKNTKFFTPDYCKHNITITDNNINIGCEQHSLKYWLKNYRKIGKYHGYDKKAIELYGAQLKVIKLIKEYHK